MKYAVIRVPDSFEFEADHYHPEGRAIVVRCDEADVVDLCRWFVEGLARLSVGVVETGTVLDHFYGNYKELGLAAEPLGMEDSPEP